MSKRRVLLIGWDAADWKAIQPLLSKGEMPNLARLIASGVHGNIATIYPVLSPMLWTSIATGKRAYKHGIHGFSEPLPDNSGVRPISILSRKTKAVWNILNQTGHRSIVVGWWPSHPAEPLNGVMVSNHFQHPAGEVGAMPPVRPGTVHPASLAPSLSELRVNPMELDGDILRLFVPEYQRVDQDKDKRLHALAKIIAETMSVHAVSTELLANEEWDFAAIYYSGIDHFGHGFMRYHPPKLPWVKEDEFGIYQHVISNAYRYHDAMLGTLLEFADANTTVILLSDHGFHADHLRPGYIPAEPAGPAVEHRHYGILCMSGPEIRTNERVFGAGLLDICPTILALFGLRPGKDMDGKVLLNAFKTPPSIDPIESWDSVSGEAGTHGDATGVDAVSSAAAFRQLMELGYVAPPGGTVQETIDECIRELRYNLARAWRDANCCGETAAIAEQLWERWPKEHRFGIMLAESLGELRQVARRRTVIEELGHRIERYRAEAKAELERLDATKKEGAAATAPGSEMMSREQYEERQLRELAFGRPLLVEWLMVTQALMENKPGEAKRHLACLTSADAVHPELSQRIAGALAKFGDLEGARTILDSVLHLDPENAPAHAQMARVHVQAGRFEQAIHSAAESLSLLYFQPDMHALLGRALMQCGKYAEAEQELRVAVAQSPRNLFAHELLGQLYRSHLGRPEDAFAHEGRARSLRHELAQQSNGARSGQAAQDEGRDVEVFGPVDRNDADVPGPFGPEVDRREVITVVSGLPRSGTSMMMQLLAAGGRPALTDSKRVADEDNPLGYFEFEEALHLARDSSWVPLARGKVVKVVAQLLPLLPKGEYYNVVFMERNLKEVIASQSAMLMRQGRRSSEDAGQLLRTYAAQVARVRSELAKRTDTRMLSVDYAQLLAEPAAGVNRVARFLGADFDCEAAAQSIQPQLQRQKA